MKELTITILKDENTSALITLCRDIKNNKYYLSNNTEVRNNSIIEVSQKCFSELFLCECLSIYTSSKKNL